MSSNGNVHGFGTLTTECALCGCTQVIPTRSTSYANGDERSSTHQFYDWARQDEFWEETFAEDYNVFAAGAILSVSADGFAEPLTPDFAEDGRRTLSVVPDFGESAHWVCGPCKGKLPDEIRPELPPVDIYVV